MSLQNSQEIDIPEMNPLAHKNLFLTKEDQNMTIRSLFNVILKILGIFFIKDILATIPQVVSVIFYFTKADTIGEANWTFVMVVLTLIVYSLISYYLIFKSELIIDKLKLDKGFDQPTIPLTIHRSTILSISIIVIGGLIVAEGIPNLCRLLFVYFQEKRMSYGNPNISYSVWAACKILVGILLILGQRNIVNFIEYRRKK